MGKPLKENARTVLSYLQENVGTNVTYTQIAEATNLAPRSVNGIITSALVKRGLATRVAVEGQDKKFIVLTEEGVNYDPTTDDEAAE